MLWIWYSSLFSPRPFGSATSFARAHSRIWAPTAEGTMNFSSAANSRFSRAKEGDIAKPVMVADFVQDPFPAEQLQAHPDHLVHQTAAVEMSDSAHLEAVLPLTPRSYPCPIPGTSVRTHRRIRRAIPGYSCHCPTALEKRRPESYRAQTHGDRQAHQNRHRVFHPFVFRLVDLSQIQRAPLQNPLLAAPVA